MSGASWREKYLEWLQELADEAGARENQAARHGAFHASTVYKRAHASLLECSRDFSHPAELAELKHIGDKICRALEKKLKKHCQERGLEMPSPPGGSGKDAAESNASQPGTTRPKRKARPYVPRYRSGAYAMLLALRIYDKSHPGKGLGKTDLVRLAKSRCDQPFDTNPGAGQFYSAWSSMSMLLKHELVYHDRRRNAQYYVTESGRGVADSLLAAERDLQNDASPVQEQTATEEFAQPVTPVARRRSSRPSPLHPSPLHPSPVSGTSGYKTRVWEPGSYTIQLLVDNREVRSKTSDRDFFARELAAAGVSVDVTALSVGDMAWAARHKRTGQLAITDFVVERKRMDDLIASIKDGRFREQKGRLHRSTCAHVIYLVEEIANWDKSTYSKAVHTAMSQTIVSDGFYLKRTLQTEESLSYLVTMTKSLQTWFADKALVVAYPHVSTFRASMDLARSEVTAGHALAIDFDSFQTGLSKSGMLNVREVYIKMLMSIKGVSVEKATAIQAQWPTPIALYEAYDALTSEELKESMIHVALKSGPLRQRVGRALSKAIYEVWGKLRAE